MGPLAVGGNDSPHHNAGLGCGGGVDDLGPFQVGQLSTISSYNRSPTLCLHSCGVSKGAAVVHDVEGRSIFDLHRLQRDDDTHIMGRHGEGILIAVGRVLGNGDAVGSSAGNGNGVQFVAGSQVQRQGQGLALVYADGPAGHTVADSGDRIRARLPRRSDQVHGDRTAAAVGWVKYSKDGAIVAGGRVCVLIAEADVNVHVLLGHNKLG